MPPRPIRSCRCVTSTPCYAPPFHICSRTGLSCHICTGTGLQAVVSALTAGPVAPADEIGRLNVTRIMQTCRMDGTLLKPSMPAFQLDSTFAAVLSGRGLDTFLGIESVWGTTMAARNADGAPAPVHHLILFANISAAGYDVSAGELRAIEAAHALELAPRAAAAAAQAAESISYVAREYFSGALRAVSDAAPLHVSHAAQRPPGCAHGGYRLEYYCVAFELWSVAPLPVGGSWLMLGETDKYVGVSGQRFQNFTSEPARGAFRTAVVGTQGEVVTVAVLDCRQAGACTRAVLPELARVRCVLPVGGRAVLRCDETCDCGAW